MRVLIVTQYYHPESFRINDVGEELVKRGHQVDVLAGIPNYPEGNFYKGYGVFKRRKEQVNGVNIYRAFQMPRGKKATKERLSINYLSYVVASCFWILFFFSFKKRYDASFVFQVSPVTQAIPAILLEKLRGTPVYLWVQDVWPDSVYDLLGGNNTWKNRIIKKILSNITEYVYKESFRILFSSHGMKALINRKHDYSDKCIYLPNWCEDMLEMPSAETIKLPRGFIVMMAGNIGYGVGIDSLLELVQSLSDVESLYFVFVGGGTLEDYLRKKIDEKKISNIIMTGRLPFSQMPGLYNQADCMLITLLKTKSEHLMATVPSRLQSYMTAAKPVLGMIEGSARDVIEAADCGFCVKPGEVDLLQKYIREVVLPNTEEFKKKGINARAYYEKYYQKAGCIDNLSYYLNGGAVQNPPYNVPEV